MCSVLSLQETSAILNITCSSSLTRFYGYPMYPCGLLRAFPCWNPSSETQGQIKGARESLNGRKNIYGTKKSKERRPFGTGLVRHCPQGLFSPFFTFLRAIFFRPFRLSLVPTICPWVSEDGWNQTKTKICFKVDLGVYSQGFSVRFKVKSPIEHPWSG